MLCNAHIIVKGIIPQNFGHADELSHPPEQNGLRFPEDRFKCIFLNEKLCILIQIYINKVFSKGPIDNEWALFQVMAWRRTGDKPFSEPMLVQFTDAYMRH